MRKFLLRYFLLTNAQRVALRKRPFLEKLRNPAPELRPWNVGLQHNENYNDQKPVLLIQALATPPDKIRAICLEIDEELKRKRLCLPVLLTDVADFAFYSQLGWLVEYLPKLGDEYRNNKLKYLALRYQGARWVELNNVKELVPGVLHEYG